MPNAAPLNDLLGVVGQRPLGAGNTRHAGLGHRCLGADLVTHEADGVRTRSDKDKPAFFDLLRKVGVLRKEPVAWVYGLCVGDFGRADDRRDIEIALVRRRGADAHRFVGEAHVLCLGVRLRMDDNRLDSELAASSLDAQGDLAAIGDQYLVE